MALKFWLVGHKILSFQTIFNLNLNWYHLHVVYKVPGLVPKKAPAVS